MPFLFHDGIIFKLLDVLLYLLDDSLVIHQRCVIITKKSIFPRHLGIFTDFSQTHFLHTRIKFNVNFKSIHEFTTVSTTSLFSMNSWLVFILIKMLYHNYHYYWEDCSTIATWQCRSSLLQFDKAVSFTDLRWWGCKRSQSQGFFLRASNGLFTWREEDPTNRKILEGGTTSCWVHMQKFWSARLTVEKKLNIKVNPLND